MAVFHIYGSRLPPSDWWGGDDDDDDDKRKKPKPKPPTNGSGKSLPKSLIDLLKSKEMAD